MKKQNLEAPKFSRRLIIHMAAAGVVSVAGSPMTALAKVRAPDRRLEYGEPLEECEYRQIEFRPGLHETQLQETFSVVLGMDEDAMLNSFRRYAGLPAPGCSLGGHYDLLDAESFGCFVSALARYFAITGDEAARAKVARLVHQFAMTVEPTGKIFPQTTGVAENSVSFPKYVRIVRALLDAYQLTGNTAALDVMARTTDAIIPKLIKEIGRDSTTGWNLLLPETEFLAWQCSADPRHLKIATEHLYQDFFDRLARGENCLAGRNALAHVNALASAAKAYLVLGEDRYLRAATNGFVFIEAQSYATGGWGPNECFIPQTIPWGEPIEQYLKGWMPMIKSLGESLTRTHWHFQTPTGADAHFTLARYLLRITKVSTYGDSMERVMYNTVLGALPLQKNGMAFYNSDYHPDGHKIYFGNFGFGNTGPEWPLEAGLLPLVATDYRINTYFRDADGVYVNWFIPSTLKWKQYGTPVSLTQNGTYPLSDKIVVTLDMPHSIRFNLRLRIPAWARQAAVRVNGKLLETAVKSGAFASLKQQWRPGDRIELELPRKLTLKPIDSDNPNMVALVFEPLVLFLIATDTPKFTREQLLSARRTNEEGDEWIVEDFGKPQRFVPFWRINYENYSTYHSVEA